MIKVPIYSNIPIENIDISVNTVKAVIEGTFKTLIDQGIIDGLKSVNIPIQQDFLNNTAAGRVARAQRMIPAATIEYYWYTTIEKIIITKVTNEAT